MKIYTEERLRNFEFWSGARDTVEYLTDEELDTIEAILEDSYPDGMDETDINDLFWFEDDLIAEWLGYENFEAIMYRDDEDEEDDEDDWEEEEEEEEEEE
jgi:hypothetical protein